MAWFGLDDLGSKSVEEGRKAVAETVAKLGPMFAEASTRVALILHGLADRVKFKVDIQIELGPDQTNYPKAEKPVPRTPTV